jgi:hypothetical protein
MKGSDALDLESQDVVVQRLLATFVLVDVLSHGSLNRGLLSFRSQDEDVKNISKDVFYSLASNPILKPAIEAEIRRSIASN